MENSEFEAQRKDAILEATKIGCTKVFGGGNNKLLDYNVQQIVDAGFTIEDAEYALKISKNNLDKALRLVCVCGQNEIIENDYLNMVKKKKHDLLCL